MIGEYCNAWGDILQEGCYRKKGQHFVVLFVTILDAILQLLGNGEEQPLTVLKYHITEEDGCCIIKISGKTKKNEALMAKEVLSPHLRKKGIKLRNIPPLPHIGLKGLPFLANSDFHTIDHLYSWKIYVSAFKMASSIKAAIKQQKASLTLFREVTEDESSFDFKNHYYSELSAPLLVA